MNAPRFHARYGPTIVVAALALAPFIVWATAKSLESTTNEARDWLPSHYPETVEYAWFARHFGTDDYLLITWPGCTLDDPRLTRLAEAVSATDETVAPGVFGADLFGRVVTGQSVLAELTGPPLKLSEAEASARLRGSLIGHDGQQTCAIVPLTEAGKHDMGASIRVLRRLAIEQGGVPRGDVRLGGLPAVNEAINLAGMQTLRREAFLASAVGLVIAWILFRTVRITIAVCVTGFYSAAASVAVVWLTGLDMNSILITMAPLVFVAATSGAIHLANYHRDAAWRYGQAEATHRALAHAWVPLGLATATTAVGLLSLCYSDLAPIRQFGAYSAVGVVLGLAITLLLLPAILEVWPAGDGPSASAADLPPDEETIPEAPRGTRFARMVVGHPWLFSLLGLGLVALCGTHFARLKTTVDLMRLFPADAEILRTYDWLEQQLGYLMPVEIVVRIDQRDDHLTLLEKLELVRDIERNLKELPSVGSSLSAVAFAPDLDGGRGRDWLRRSVLDKQLKRQYQQFAQSGYLTTGDGQELWRISARVGPFRDMDYGALVREFRGHVEPVVDGARDKARITVTYTGVMPVVYKARVSLLRDLMFGLSTDVILIFVAMMVLMRHWSSGVLLLLISVFPTALVFGTLAWLGVTVEIGALMAPCVALGVTVDDVIHFLLWFRRGIERGMSRKQAVLLAYESCARAMCQSWAILGLGLAVLLFSSFVPNRQFGAAMVALLTIGLIGNLLFLPALLAGPLGAIIARGVQRRQAKAKARELAAA